VPRGDDPRHSLRWRNAHDVPAYLAALEAGELPPGETEALDPETRGREALMLGLRTDEGVDVARTSARVGGDLRAGRERSIARQAAAGNLDDDGATLRIPRDRWLLADDIVSRLF
jgi:coproporphyrinogen III oxidase-like Fe-S oxidoreductase